MSAGVLGGPPGEEPTESRWVRIKGRTGTGDIIVGIRYRDTKQMKPSRDRDRSSLTLTKPGVLHGDFQPHSYLLEGQHTKA